MEPVVGSDHTSNFSFPSLKYGPFSKFKIEHIVNHYVYMLDCLPVYIIQINLQKCVVNIVTQLFEHSSTGL